MESPAIIDPPMIMPVSLPQQQLTSDSGSADVAPERRPAFAVERLSIFYGEKKAIEDVTFRNRTQAGVTDFTNCGSFLHVDVNAPTLGRLLAFKPEVFEVPGVP